ncbi:hypothetical protein V6Z11_A09G134300 [Gossypium hirsutum]
MEIKEKEEIVQKEKKKGGEFFLEYKKRLYFHTIKESKSKNEKVDFKSYFLVLFPSVFLFYLLIFFAFFKFPFYKNINKRRKRKLTRPGFASLEFSFPSSESTQGEGGGFFSFVFFDIERPHH